MYSNNRSNRNESRRPYSSQGSYSSRSDSRWTGREENRDRNFSSHNDDEQMRDFNMENSSPRREWDYESGTRSAYGRGDNHLRQGNERYSNSMNDRSESRDFSRGNDRSRDNAREYDRYSADRNNERSSYGKNDSYGRSYESSRFNEDRESDSSPSYGSYSRDRDYSSQNYSDRDAFGSTSYSGRGDRLREDNYGSSSTAYGRGDSLRNQSSSRMSSFEGRGPKSYTRSDDRIKEEVCDMLTRHSEIDASEIEVEVKDGEVTLSGTVSERRMKHQAEDLAERISSVKDVTNNIRVVKESTHDWSSSSDINTQSEMGASSENATSSTKGTGTSGKRASSSSSTSSTQNPNH